MIEEYIRRVGEIRGAIRPGEVTGLIVSHDDWCPCADGTHPITDCICDPDIEMAHNGS